MAKDKRFYWFKMKQDFFDSLRQKRLIRHDRGYEFEVIYLRLMLLALNTDGKIMFQHLFDNLEDEIAERLSIPSDSVAAALSYLSEIKLVELDEESCFIPEVLECTGSEGASAERQRRYAKRKASEPSESDAVESESDTEEREEKEEDEEEEKEEDEEGGNGGRNVDFDAIHALRQKVFKETEG